VDANNFSGKGYRVLEVGVDAALYEYVKANPLFVRTLDTGSADGRAGLYFIPEVFGADGIVVTKATYRTHPIQVFHRAAPAAGRPAPAAGLLQPAAGTPPRPDRQRVHDHL
jgi:hypothetical protein